jgi:hypothetical protein
MAGPWELYAKEAPVEAAPWEAYKPSTEPVEVQQPARQTAADVAPQPSKTTPEEEQGFIEQFGQFMQTPAVQRIARGPVFGAIPQETIEAGTTIATAAAAEPIAGIRGAAEAPFSGAEKAAKSIEETRKALTIQPQTEAGREELGSIGDLIQKGIDIANIPISGLAGIAELISGQGVDQAAETIKSIQKEGLSKTLGERVFEETGSPLAASIAETAPEAVLASLGVKKTPKGAPDITPQRAKEIDDVLKASEKTGVDVMTTDIFQPRSIFSRMSQQFSERIPVLGVGGKRSAQQMQRVEALEALDQSVPRVEASDIFSSLDRSANKVRKAAGKRLNGVVSTMNDFGSVPVGNTIKRIDASIEKLSKPGKLANDALVDDLNNLKQTLVEGGIWTEGSNFKSLRDFRSDARAIADKVDPTGRSQLRSSDKALMDDVINGITKDLDEFVLDNSGKSGLEKYKAADRVYSQEARKLTKSRLKTVLDKGDVKPELVNNLLYSSSPSEVKLLFKNLDTQGRHNARMSLYRRAIDNATKKGEISPQRFVGELDKLKGGFDTFFRGEAKAELHGLKKLMEATGRADVAGTVTPTGQALQLPATAGVAAAAAVGDVRAISALLGASTIGLAARGYESAGVRNMLIRLGKAPKRSTLEADLKRSIPILLAEANRGIEQATQEEESP